MVDKRQEGHVEGADREPTVTEKHQDAILEKLPDGLAPLKTIHDDNYSELKALAEQMVTMARKRFGPQSSKPRLKRVEDLFSDKAGKAPRVDEELDRSIRQLSVIPQVAALDQEYDKAIATGFNIFDKASSDSGSSVQQAYDDWTLAMRLYDSALRSSGAIFVAAIEVAKSKSHGLPSDGFSKDRTHLEYYTKSAAIAAALVIYETAMAKASADLAAAFGKLIAGLFGGFAKVAVAEGTSISTSQTASLNFWTKLHANLNKSRN